MTIRPALLVMLLFGCAPSYSPDTYSSAAVQQASKVEQGVVVGVRKVAVQASGSTGALTGAAAGGIAASQAPIGGVGSALSTLGGTLVGGLVGTGIERATGDTTAFEYIVRKPNGELLSVTQKDEIALALGQKVLLIAGTQARIVADYTTPAEAPKPVEPAASAAVVPVTREPIAAPGAASGAVAPAEP
jgi:outer membrane lipoprotein SlyB